MSVRQIISIEEVKDWMFCPLYWKYKHKDKVEANSMSTVIIDKFKRDVRSIARYVFQELYNTGVYPSLKEVKKAWGDRWYGTDVTRKDFLLKMSHWQDIYWNKEIEGINSIVRFYRDYEDNFGQPVMCSTLYTVEMGDIEIRGEVDIVRVIDRKIELIYLDTNPYPVHIDKDIAITCASYATRKLLGKKEDYITCYHLPTGQKTRLTKNKEDFILVYKIIKRIYAAMKNDLVYPVLNRTCHNCRFNYLCRSNLSI